MSMRQHSYELVRAVAQCQRCSFRVDSKNAQALAAKHHDQKRHPVAVEMTTRIIYGASPGTGKGKSGDQKELL